MTDDERAHCEWIADVLLQRAQRDPQTARDRLVDLIAAARATWRETGRLDVIHAVEGLTDA